MATFKFTSQLKQHAVEHEHSHPVLRLLVHYAQQSQNQAKTEYQPDFIVRYTYINPSALHSLQQSSLEELLSGLQNGARKSLRSVIEREDSSALYHIIQTPAKRGKFNKIRGKIAEMLFHYDVASVRSLHQDVSYVPNPFVDIHNKTYESGTELDGIFYFYDFSAFKQFITGIAQLDHLELEVNAKHLSGISAKKYHRLNSDIAEHFVLHST